MAKSKVRKNKKYVQKDSSGKHVSARTKNHIQEAKRAMMYRTFTLQNASSSLSAKELNILLDSAIERRDSSLEVKKPKPIMTYIETIMDENQVPMDGESKEIELSAGDIPKLRQIMEMKEQAEEQLKAQVTKSD